MLFLIMRSGEGILRPPEATEKEENAQATEPCLASERWSTSEESVEQWWSAREAGRLGSGCGVWGEEGPRG